MDRSQIFVGMRVKFGRENGAWTQGKVIKLNSVRCKVKSLEARGNRPAGTTWNVDYSLLESAMNDPMPATAVNKLEYNVFSPDNPFLDLVLNCYCGLSPENLSCDGEASVAHQRAMKAKLERQLRGLQMALGYDVTEEQIYAWDEARRSRV